MFRSKLKTAPQILILVLAALCLASGPLLGQQNKPSETSDNIIESVFQDVWKPFMESYRELDVAKFQSIHSKDLTRGFYL